jgi:peptide deformylase
MKASTILLIGGGAILLYFLFKKKKKKDEEIVIYINPSKVQNSDNKGNYITSGCVPNPDILKPYEAYNNIHNQSYASSMAKQQSMNNINSAALQNTGISFFDNFFQ